MSNFNSFNPLDNNDSILAAVAVRKLIHNLLTSYNGWYDPFCEAIQNALDSVEKRTKLEGRDYQPSIWVTINLTGESEVLHSKILQSFAVKASE